MLAGYELDPKLLTQRPGRLAMAGWLLTALMSLGIVAGLSAAGFVRDMSPSRWP